MLTTQRKVRSLEDCCLYKPTIILSSLVATIFYLINHVLQPIKVLKLMCFICKKNNKRTKKPVNLFWQDGAKAGIETFTEIKLSQTPANGL